MVGIHDAVFFRYSQLVGDAFIKFEVDDIEKAVSSPAKILLLS